MGKEHAPGDRLGDWALQMPIGEGGNGEVWKAVRQDAKVGALKVLFNKYQDAGNRRYQRFKDEARAHQALSELPGVLPVLDLHVPELPSVSNPGWLVTELAERLDSVLSNRSDLAEVLTALTSIADTLAAIHERGYSHRDIKPSNLYRFHGRWCIGDFGLVDYPGKDGITKPGDKLGPQHFIAPEMLHEADEADGKSADVYSLAKTLFVVATGQNYAPPGPLFHDEPGSTVSAYVANQLALHVDRLLERATRNDPAKRPTMQEIARELKTILAPAPAVTLPAELSVADLAKRIERAVTVTRVHHRCQEEANAMVQKLVDGLEHRLKPLEIELQKASLEYAGFSRRDGTLTSRMQNQPSADQMVFTDPRTLRGHVILYLGEPRMCTIALLFGFGATLLSSGRLHIHATVFLEDSATGFKELWSCARETWPNSAECDRICDEAIAELQTRFRPTFAAFLALVESKN